MKVPSECLISYSERHHQGWDLIFVFVFLGYSVSILASRYYKHPGKYPWLNFHEKPVVGYV